jgi:hypothetical protein
MKTLERDDGFIKSVLVILVLVMACYVGFQFGMPYYRYEALKSESVELARVSLGNAGKLRESILERAGELKVPLQQDSLIVEKAANNRMHVNMSWSEEVDIFGIYQKTLAMTVDFVE